MTATPPTWEQRWHPLREEWVVVAAHRQNLAGPEIGGGNFLSDTSPEASAAVLEALPAMHHAGR